MSHKVIKVLYIADLVFHVYYYKKKAYLLLKFPFKFNEIKSGSLFMKVTSQ